MPRRSASSVPEDPPGVPGAPRPPAAPLEALYQERILEHFRHPHGKGRLADFDATATARNPLCGEDVTVMATFDRTADGPRVREVGFLSDGCSIAQASASMMTDAIRGRTPAEIAALAAAVRAAATGDPAAARDPNLGPLVALTSIARVPARLTCAMLAWDAMLRIGNGSADG